MKTIKDGVIDHFVIFAIQTVFDHFYNKLLRISLNISKNRSYICRLDLTIFGGGEPLRIYYFICLFFHLESCDVPKFY